MTEEKPRILTKDESAAFMRIRDIHPVRWSEEDVALIRGMLDRLHPSGITPCMS